MKRSFVLVIILALPACGGKEVSDDGGVAAVDAASKVIGCSGGIGQVAADANAAGPCDAGQICGAAPNVGYWCCKPGGQSCGCGAPATACP
ncbi:hypothetical protein BH09MYX1_BH09MYX1_47550 [soil metagenome]